MLLHVKEQHVYATNKNVAHNKDENVAFEKQTLYSWEMYTIRASSCVSGLSRATTKCQLT